MADNIFERLFNNLCDSLKQCGHLESLSQDFRQCVTDSDRVNFLLNVDAVKDIIQLPTELLETCTGGKCKDIATIKRDLGNKEFQKHNYFDALCFYNESIAYSPVDGNHSIDIKAASIDTQFNDINLNGDSLLCLALSYANRSAVLFHLKEYELATNDINAAIKYNYPLSMQYKLYERKARCLLFMGRTTEAVDCFEKSLKLIENSDLAPSKREEFRKTTSNYIAQGNKSHNSKDGSRQLTFVELKAMKLAIDIDSEKGLPSKYSSDNGTFPSLSDAVNIVYSDTKGRYLVANQDIPAGSVILVEKPYASVLLPDQRYNHCGYCYGYSLALKPCEVCHSVMYCSDDCQALDKAGHSISCNNLFDILKKSGVDKFALLALAAVVKMSRESLQAYKNKVDNGQYRLDQLQANGHFPGIDSGDITSGCNENGVYLANEYIAICSLVTNSYQRTAHDLFRRAVIAIYLLRVLDHIGYFTPQSDDLEIYIGGLLLSHLQSFPCNAHEIPEFNLALDTGVANSEPCELGAGIYSTLSLFNHSCDPAVSRNFYGQVCVVRTIRTVYKFEEISDNYGAVYAMQGLVERREKMLKQYYFICECEACEGNWPLYADSRSMAPTWKCYCNDLLGKCSVCELTEAERLNKISQSYKRYKIAFDLLLKGKVRLALPELLKHLEVMCSLCKRPWSEFSNCQEALKQCYSLMSNSKIY